MSLSPTKEHLLRLLLEHGTKSSEELACLAKDVPILGSKKLDIRIKIVSTQLSQIFTLSSKNVRKGPEYLARKSLIKDGLGSKGGSCRYFVYTITAEGVNYLEEIDKEKSLVSVPSNSDKIFALNQAFFGNFKRG